MRVRRLTIERFRGYESFAWCPQDRNLILGPNGSGKSTILEALDWLFDPGWGRPRPAPRMEDYWRRNPTPGYRIEAVLGDLSQPDLAAFDDHLEGWRTTDETLVAEPGGEGIETVVRVEVRGTSDFDTEYRMAKVETAEVPFGPRLRRRVNFVFDGRNRDPARQLAFYQGSVLEKVFGHVDLAAPLRGLAERLGDGERAVNDDPGVAEVLRLIRTTLVQVGIGAPGAGTPLLSVGGLSDRELLQALSLALRHDEMLALPVSRQGRGLQRIALVAFLLVLAGRGENRPIAAFEEPEEALEPFRVCLLTHHLRDVASSGGQVFVSSHSPEVLRCFQPDEIVLLSPPGSATRLVELRKRLGPPTKFHLERHMDGPVANALFSPVAFLVDGPSERGAIPVFWDQLAATGGVLSAETLGVQIVNCEGVTSMPGIAEVLAASGKVVIALMDRDPGDERARDRERIKQWARSWILHQTRTVDLEGILAYELPLPALVRGMETIAHDRGLAWEQAREAIVARLPEHTPLERRRAAREQPNMVALIAGLNDIEAREAIRMALKSGPLEAKGGRPSRLLAQAAVEEGAVPQSLRRAIQAVAETVLEGRSVQMDLDVDAAVI